MAVRTVVSPLGLCCGGSVCLLAVASVYLGAEHDMLPTWMDTLPSAGQILAMGVATVLGVILMSVGVAGGLLSVGVFTLPTNPSDDYRARSHSDASPSPEGTPPPSTPPTPGARVATPIAPGGPESGLLPGDGAPELGKRRCTGTSTGGEAPQDLSVAEARDEKQGERPLSVASAATPSSLADALAPEPQPADLVAAWDTYRRTGDGHFNPHGLQRVLDERGIRAAVSGGDRIDASGNVLIVEAPSRRPQFYVLPSFAKSPRAVRDWFDDSSGGALTSRTQRVIQVGEGRWIEGGFELVRKGVVA